MTHNFYKKFTNQGPAYFGDLDEADGKLLKYEEAAEQEGMFVAFVDKHDSEHVVHQAAGRMGGGTCTPARSSWPSGRLTYTSDTPRHKRALI